jgi:hypothetical protein
LAEHDIWLRTPAPIGVDRLLSHRLLSIMGQAASGVSAHEVRWLYDLDIE